jgi:hypothetical protein
VNTFKKDNHSCVLDSFPKFGKRGFVINSMKISITDITKKLTKIPLTKKLAYQNLNTGAKESFE